MLKTIFEDGTYFNNDGIRVKASLPEMMDEMKELTDFIRTSSDLIFKGYQNQVDCLEHFMKRYFEVQSAIKNSQYIEVNPYGNL